VRDEPAQDTPHPRKLRTTAKPHSAMPGPTFTHLFASCLSLALLAPTVSAADADTNALRVFIFAGQSNMVGSDSKAGDIRRFPPFVGLDLPQDNVLLSYNIGGEEKLTSGGWIPLRPVNDVVGPELSFTRRVSQETKVPIAIIKCAAGGTTLGGDWNPDEASGFKLYPLALELVKSSLAELERKGVPYRLEGFMWHQGENDMFHHEFKPGNGREGPEPLPAVHRLHPGIHPGAPDPRS
ncbi:MAG: sialate O-acetylesterase, partial [Planctomycetota bacterium]|nr:sialate O-acetylesterase [Planctomycetota bacterium]